MKWLDTVCCEYCRFWGTTHTYGSIMSKDGVLIKWCLRFPDADTARADGKCGEFEKEQPR